MVERGGGNINSYLKALKIVSVGSLNRIHEYLSQYAISESLVFIELNVIRLKV